jgi:hypothetical protein
MIYIIKKRFFKTKVSSFSILFFLSWKDFSGVFEIYETALTVKHLIFLINFNQALKPI